MAIVRTQKRENPFVQIDKGIFEDPRISWKAKGVLGYLLSKPDNWTIVLNDIVNKSPDGLTVVRSALKELQENGYASLEIAREEKTGKLSGKVWVIFEEPKHRHTENTDVGENRLSGKPSFGKSHTSNNDLINNNTSIREKEPPQKNQPDVKIENEEIEVIAPEPDLYEYAGLVKELGKLKDDTPANRVMALRLYEVHIQGAYFQDSWQYLSGYSGVPPGVVMKEWIMKGVWHEIKEARYNKIGNWIKVQKRISKEENQKNGKIFSEEKLRALDRELDSLGY